MVAAGVKLDFVREDELLGGHVAGFDLRENLLVEHAEMGAVLVDDEESGFGGGDDPAVFELEHGGGGEGVGVEVDGDGRGLEGCFGILLVEGR